MYVTDFAARVDEVSRNFSLVRSCSGNFCGYGVCQWFEAGILPASPCLFNLPEVIIALQLQQTHAASQAA